MILAEFKRLDVGVTLVMVKNTWFRATSEKKNSIGKKRKIVAKQTNGTYLKGKTEDSKSWLEYPTAKGFSYKQSLASNFTRNGIIRIVHDLSHPELYIEYIIA